MATAAPLDYAPMPAKPDFNWGVWIRLSVMMFLQFAVWGSWFTVLGNYLGNGLHFDKAQTTDVYGTMALGAIIAMMIAGQLADRVMASEYLMAIFHLVGAGLLFLLTKVESFGAFWWVAFAYALVFNPTLTIANALAFANIKSSTHFAWVRVFGTAGWIVAGYSVDYILPKGAADTNLPIMMAAGLSAVLGVFSFLLPHTPPSGKKGDALPFLKAFGLLKDPSFAIFFGLSFAITIALAFYYGLAGTFLGDTHVEKVASTMTWGQFSEVGFMLLLPLALKRFGMKVVLAVGMTAWVLRYGLWSVAADGQHYPLLILGVLLHGVCFDFFLAAGFIHTENKAPAAIRGSAQALFSFLTYGVGMFIGNFISGRITDAYKTVTMVTKVVDNVSKSVEVTTYDWGRVWLYPAVGAAVCLLLFILLWRDKKGKVDDGSLEAAELRGLGDSAQVPQ